MLKELDIKILEYVENHSPFSDNIYLEFEKEFEDIADCENTLKFLVKENYIQEQEDYYKITESGITVLYELGQASSAAFKDKEGKIYYDIDWQMIQDLGEHLYKNKVEAGGKYLRDNWKKGMNIQDMSDAIDRHYIKMKLGWEDEDHALALISNLMILRYLKRQQNS
jgi:hypothetical protein